MKKLLAIIAGVVVLSGCTDPNTGIRATESIRCIKGVEYYASGYRLAPAFKPDGTLYTCENKHGD